MKLYDHPGNPNSRKIRAAAHEAGVTLEIIPVDFTKGEHKTETFLRLNPNGKVPTLVDGDFTLWESNAIMTYVAGSRGPTPLLPTNAREKAQTEQWLLWQVAHLSAGFHKIMMERVYKPRYGMGTPDPAGIEAGEAEVQRFTGVLDTVLSGRDFLVGRGHTVADFAVAGAYGVRDMAQVDVAGFAHVAAWLKRVEALPSWVAAG